MIGCPSKSPELGGSLPYGEEEGGDSSSEQNVHHIKYLYDPKDKECQNEEKKGAKG